VYYTALHQHPGCIGYSHEAAVLWGGNDIACSIVDFNWPPVFGTLLQRSRLHEAPGRERSRLRWSSRVALEGLH